MLLISSSGHRVGCMGLFGGSSHTLRTRRPKLFLVATRVLLASLGG